MEELNKLDVVLIFISSLVTFLLAVSEWLANSNCFAANSITELVRQRTHESNDM